jgi:hypothetical protein
MTTSKQSTTTSQSQNGTISPWEPAQGALNGILSGINSNGFGPTGAQSSAVGQLQTAAQAAPNYGTQAADVANSLLTGGQNFAPTVNNAYSQYQGAVNPFLSSSLDPTQTPGISNALDAIRNDVSNSVNGMFAGAGRDLSGLNQQSLARGISQGEAPVLLDQYNQNVNNRMNAANGILGAGQSTANTLSGLQQTQFGNQVQGVNLGTNAVPAAYMSNANNSLNAANTAYNLPFQNLASAEALTLPIAGLGRQYTGNASGQSDTSSTKSPFDAAMQVAGLFSGGSGSAASGILSFL